MFRRVGNLSSAPDPELSIQIARACKGIIAHHICDWLVPTKHMLADRGMMGDGVIDFRAIRRMVEAAGYHGIQEVEIFSDHWWAGRATRYWRPPSSGSRRCACSPDGAQLIRGDRCNLHGRSRISLRSPSGLRDLVYWAAAGIATGTSCFSTTEWSGSSQNAHMAEPMTSKVAATMNGACQLAYWAK